LRLIDFSFDLPPELIAQEPTPERGQSRLLVADRATGRLEDRVFTELPLLLRRGDLLVFNNTRVFAARLLGRRLPGGGAAECLLVRRLEATSPTAEIWEALVHPGQRLKEGSRLELGSSSCPVHAQILERRFHGRRRVRIWTEGGSIEEAVDRAGHVPLPPYIKRADAPTDRDRYQTVYARERGSIAAPTAGLHFTPQILAALDAAGIQRSVLTLHVGYGTFQPIRVEQVEDHQMEPEHYDLPAGTGATNLFIVPGHQFRVVSGLITNFHLPQSSLLLLVSAFAGRDRALAAYRHGVEKRYRFYSYGDAMVVL
jgi:S-adenosylmethionine:tRNA ribosyltransferase-isomerase